MSKQDEMKEARRLWVEALRSGGYEQGRDYLQSDGKFCCLGVACEVFIKAGNDLVKTAMQTSTCRNFVQYDYSSCATTPTPVQEWLGLRDVLGKYWRCARLVASNLAKDNDRGMPFSRIADIIESEPEGLFIDAP